VWVNGEVVDVEYKRVFCGGWTSVKVKSGPTFVIQPAINTFAKLLQPTTAVSLSRIQIHF